MNRNRDIIKIKSKSNKNENLYLEGNIIKQSSMVMLIEKTSVRQEDKFGDFSLSSQFNADELKKPFAVILKSNNENEASFFDDIEQAKIFYEKQKTKFF